MIIRSNAGLLTHLNPTELVFNAAQKNVVLAFCGCCSRNPQQAPWMASASAVKDLT